MKALTIQVFVDKFTGAQFTLGSVYEAEPARIAELVAAGVVEPLEEEAKEKKPAKARTSKAKK